MSDVVEQLAEAKVDYTDYLILGVVALVTAAWFTKGKLWAVAKKEETPVFAKQQAGRNSRNIVQRMQQQVSD